MKIHQVMRSGALTCHATESLADAARLMWNANCGALVVVDFAGKAIGMITDRDIAMAAYTQGRSLDAIRVEVASSATLHAVGPDDDVSDAEALMARRQVRRVPVVDRDGRPIGMLTLNALVRAARSRNGHALDPRGVLQTFAAVNRARTHVRPAAS